MPIVVTCPRCGKKLRARDEQAGRSCRCPACATSMQVPYPVATAVAPPSTPSPQRSTPTPAAPAPIPNALARPVAAGAPAPWHAPSTEPPASTPPAQPDDEVAAAETTWRAHVYWLLLIAVIPLLVLTFAREPDYEAMLEKAFAAQPESPAATQPAGGNPQAVAPQAAGADADEDEDESADGTVAGMDVAELNRRLLALPGRRIAGAMLARDAWSHWLLAVVAAAAYFGVVAVALPADRSIATPKHLIAAGVFTGTLGVTMLLLVQYFGVLFCCVGVWYIAALDPRAPFGPSLLGFIFGVGVCEEIIKCVPVLWAIHRQDITGGEHWREACLIGMASGAGFAVSEAVHYCATYYNGIVGPEIYLVRFFSTCTLHVMLSGACAILIHRKQRWLDDWLDPYDWVLTMTAIMLVPIVLHGLFNATLKMEWELAALATWLASFAWLAWLITRSRQRERVRATALAAGPKLVRTEKGTRFVAP